MRFATLIIIVSSLTAGLAAVVVPKSAINVDVGDNDNNTDGSFDNFDLDLATLKCTTKISSPTVSEIQGAWQQIRDREVTAKCSHNATTGQCTRIAFFQILGLNGAGVYLCGGHAFSVECGKAADAVRKIQLKCDSEYRASGRLNWGGDKRIEVR